MPSSISPGEVVGNYRIEKSLGGGGMGQVYKASHVVLGRAVAIKILNDELADDENYVSRFMHEARVVNDIRHPNIIDIVDFLDLPIPRRVAYVMELLEGRALRDIVAPGAVSMMQAANACLQLISALRAVHRAGVVHRDLKPENIFIIAPLDSDWSIVPAVKVLDFGIAKFQSKEVKHKTETGMVVGTPAYMAPEQLLGLPVSTAADVYALGELLFELLTGKRLFEGDDVVRQKMQESPASVFLFPQITQPNLIEQLIRRCISSNPRERPSLDEIEQGLKALTAGDPVALQSLATGTPLTGAPVPTNADRPSAKDRDSGTSPAAAPVEAAPPEVAPAPLPNVPPPQARPFTTPQLSAPVAQVMTPPKSRVTPVAIGAAILLVAVGATIVAAMDKPSAEPTIQPKAAAPAPAVVKVQVTSEPRGAMVIDSETGAVLGSTPVDVPLEGAQPRKVRLVLPDHQPGEMTLDADHEKAKIVLPPTPAAPPPPAAQTPPKPATEPKPARPKAPPVAAPPQPQPVVAPHTDPGTISKPKPLRKDEKTQW
jgi:eukaryotic-like serine/threonine-protein kinase